jgi:ribulose bisphosphate carboxylase small subunit
MTTVPAQKTSDATLPADLKVELWKRVDRRLNNGEVLITNEQFFKAMVRDFRRLVGVVPDRPVKTRILEMILHVNEKHPETYLSAGIKNAVNAFFKSTGDDEAREMIVRIVKEGRTAMWLEGMGISVDPRMLTGPVEQAIIRVTEGKKLKSAPRRETRKRRPRRGAGMVGVNSSEVEQPSSEPVAPPA